MAIYRLGCVSFPSVGSSVSPLCCVGGTLGGEVGGTGSGPTLGTLAGLVIAVDGELLAVGGEGVLLEQVVEEVAGGADVVHGVVGGELVAEEAGGLGQVLAEHLVAEGDGGAVVLVVVHGVHDGGEGRDGDAPALDAGDVEADVVAADDVGGVDDGLDLGNALGVVEGLEVALDLGDVAVLVFDDESRLVGAVRVDTGHLTGFGPGLVAGGAIETVDVDRLVILPDVLAAGGADGAAGAAIAGGDALVADGLDGEGALGDLGVGVDAGGLGIEGDDGQGLTGMVAELVLDEVGEGLAGLLDVVDGEGTMSLDGCHDSETFLLSLPRYPTGLAFIERLIRSFL